MSDLSIVLWSFGTLAIIAIGSHIYIRIEEDGLVNLLKKRAAAVICIGLGVLAAGIFLRDSYAFGEGFADAARDGHVALFGAAVTLVGLFFWLSGTEDRIHDVPSRRSGEK